MIRVVSDGPALAEEAAAAFARAAQASIEERGRFAVALAGGHTPIPTYRELAGPHRGDVAWDRVQLFWGDERLVPPDDPDSNYRMVRETLLVGAPVPEAQIHPVPTELGAAEAVAAAYEATLRCELGPDEVQAGAGSGASSAGSTAGVRFDLVLLGLGDNAHTASLMPGCPALAETRRLVATCLPKDLPHPRVTLTLPAINAARQVIFLVSGASKAGALARVLEGGEPPSAAPAAGVRPAAGDLLWLVDRAAAGSLHDETLTTIGRARGAVEGNAP